MDVPLYRLYSDGIDVYRSQFNPQILPELEPYRCKQCGYFDDDEDGLCSNHTGGSNSIGAANYGGFGKMHDLLDTLELKCHNWRHGCGAVMRLDHLREHALCCKFRDKQCDDCNSVIEWRCIEENRRLGKPLGCHRDCPMQLTTCPKCQLTMYNSQLSDHYRHHPTSCDRLSSKTFDCKYGRLPDAPDICRGKFTHKELADHELRFLQQHLDVTWTRLTEMEAAVVNVSTGLGSMLTNLSSRFDKPDQPSSSSSSAFGPIEFR